MPPTPPRPTRETRWIDIRFDTWTRGEGVSIKPAITRLHPSLLFLGVTHTLRQAQGMQWWWLSDPGTASPPCLALPLVVTLPNKRAYLVYSRK